MDNLPEPFYHGTVLCVAIYILSSLLKLLEIYYLRSTNEELEFFRLEYLYYIFRNYLKETLFEVLELLLTMLIEQEIDQ
jgi:hypothetical protein